MPPRLTSISPLLRQGEIQPICRSLFSSTAIARAEGGPLSSTNPLSLNPAPRRGIKSLEPQLIGHAGIFGSAPSSNKSTTATPSASSTDPSLSQPTSRDTNRYAFAQDLVKSRRRNNTQEEITKFARAHDIERQQTRRWKQGDVYAPRDIGPNEMLKWRRRTKPSMDAFDILAINPLHQYKVFSLSSSPSALSFAPPPPLIPLFNFQAKPMPGSETPTNNIETPQNFAIMSEYMTSMGRIKGAKDTGLRPVNQRRVAKAIRRSIGMGLMPSVHRHPEILEAEARERGIRRSF
ncbi:MAG: hypothetical protein M1819_000977 [Sarea resinae]|nr:MAG: hypothetical protein M1819_000977 [Sarea resinae]